MPKEDPNDTLLVRNIDIDCSDYSTDFVKTSQTVTDDEGNRVTEFIDISYEFDHSQEFQVRWGGQKFRIAPGETRRMPRYIAEHYAKHLADHMLAKREIEEKKIGLINHPVERPKLMGDILIGVDQYWDDLGQLDEGSEALQKVEELNQEQPISNAYAQQFGGGKATEIKGEVDAGVIGRDRPLAKEELLPTDEILDNIIKSEIENQSAPEEFQSRNKHDLVKEIRTMDPTQKLTGKETKNQLINVLKGL